MESSSSLIFIAVMALHMGFCTAVGILCCPDLRFSGKWNLFTSGFSNKWQFFTAAFLPLGFIIGTTFRLWGHVSTGTTADSLWLIFIILMGFLTGFFAAYSIAPQRNSLSNIGIESHRRITNIAKSVVSCGLVVTAIYVLWGHVH